MMMTMRMKTSQHHKSRHTKKGKPTARLTTWKKVDLDNHALPEYQHFPPDYIETPYNYFSRYFSPQVIKHITYQTNLYATQKDINTTFTTTEEETRNSSCLPAVCIAATALCPSFQLVLAFQRAMRQRVSVIPEGCLSDRVQEQRSVTDFTLGAVKVR
ncbi:hypothetical protein QQF64_007868 [Cirrhinus molitorella]|uniref:Uncharacterized protein n=1 Tax=Cirrhinus molitorella TaxID=172907 RepID=A0ABR3M6V3_9TELE